MYRVQDDGTGGYSVRCAGCDEVVFDTIFLIHRDIWLWCRCCRVCVRAFADTARLRDMLRQRVRGKHGVVRWLQQEVSRLLLGSAVGDPDRSKGEIRILSWDCLSNRASRGAV